MATKKTTTKVEEVKAVAPAVEAPKAAPAKKAPAKKAAKAVASKVTVQFGEKSYSQEDLVKIAQDVWVYDLQMKAEDLVSVELYVKPEEGLTYYVMNGDITGAFNI